MRRLFARKRSEAVQVQQLIHGPEALTVANLPDRDTPVIRKGDLIGVDQFAIVGVHECGDTPYALIRPFDKRFDAWTQARTIELWKLELA